MVNKCCAYGCKSGYDSQDATGLRITFHSFPRDEELRAKWIRANPRKDFTSTNNSRMCSLHFAESDFVEQHCDSNQSRYRSFNSPQLQRRYLKKDAVPSIFNDAPSYLSSPSRHLASRLLEHQRVVADYKKPRDSSVLKKLSQLTIVSSP